MQTHLQVTSLYYLSNTYWTLVHNTHRMACVAVSYNTYLLYTHLKYPMITPACSRFVRSNHEINLDRCYVSVLLGGLWLCPQNCCYSVTPDRMSLHLSGNFTYRYNDAPPAGGSARETPPRYLKKLWCEGLLHILDQPQAFLTSWNMITLQMFCKLLG